MLKKRLQLYGQLFCPIPKDKTKSSHDSRKININEVNEELVLFSSFICNRMKKS